MTSPSILIVDDEIDLLDLFSSALERMNYRVLKARGGRKALEILQHERPDLILLDVAMPEVNGVDVLRAIRADPLNDSTKIVLLTAAPALVTGDDAQLANRMIIKPITVRELDKVVQAVLAS